MSLFNTSPLTHMLPSKIHLLLLTRHRLYLALARAGIGLRTLTADRQVANVQLAPVALNLLQSLDVHRDEASEFTLNLVLLHLLTQDGEFLLGKFAHALVLQLRGRHDCLGGRRTDAVHVRERRFGALIVRDLDPSNTGGANAQITTALRDRLFVK